MPIVHHGYEFVSLKKIRAPGDIEKLRKEQHTIELGESLASTGGKPASPIVLEVGTFRLLGGRHRFAAALNKRLPGVYALMLEGTPEELEQACLVEQIRRRKASDTEVARLLELEHPTPEQTFPDVPDVLPEARPRTKKEAIEKVAAITGRTTRAVQQADYRARRDAKVEDEDGEEDTEETTCIATMGVKVPAEVHADAYAEHVHLEAIAKTLAKLQGDCSRHSIEYPQLYDAIHDAAAVARSQMPKSVCPHCKLTPLRKGCLACRGRGWLREFEMRNIPPQLMDAGSEAAVFVDGHLTLCKDVK